MKKWYVIPNILPAIGIEVWIRTGFNYSNTFKATLDSGGQRFVSSDNSIAYPVNLIAKWREL